MSTFLRHENETESFIDCDSLHRISRSGQPFLVFVVVTLAVVFQTARTKSQWLTIATFDLTMGSHRLGNARDLIVDRGARTTTTCGVYTIDTPCHSSMAEKAEPEPDIPTQLKDIGKKYLKVISKGLDSLLEEDKDEDDLEIEEAPPVKRKRTRRAKKPVSKPTKDVGILGWLKGPKAEDRKDS